MTEGHSINAPIMILGVIIGITLVGWGWKCRNIFLYVRSLCAFGFFAIITSIAVFSYTELLSGIFQKGSVGLLWNLFFQKSSLFETIVKICILVIFGSISYILQRKASLFSSLFSTIVIYGACAYFLLLEYIGVASNPIVLGVTVASIVVVSSFHMIKPMALTMFETTLTGAFLTSYLSYRFYYLSFALFLTFFFLLCIGGFALQWNAMKRQKRKERIFSGDESV